MQTSNFRRLILIALGSLVLSVAAVSADQTVDTGIAGGDGKDLLTSGKNPAEMSDEGTIVVHDEDCAKRTKNGPKLKSGAPNPAYIKCVHDKLEKAKKKGEH